MFNILLCLANKREKKPKYIYIGVYIWTKKEPKWKEINALTENLKLTVNVDHMSTLSVSLKFIFYFVEILTTIFIPIDTLNGTLIHP